MSDRNEDGARDRQPRAHGAGEEVRQALDRTSDMVSVNVPLTLGTHPLVKLAALIVGVCVLVIGFLMWFKQWQATKRADAAKQEQLEKRENTAAHVGMRRTFDTDAAALSHRGAGAKRASGEDDVIVPELEAMPGEGRPIPLAGRRNNTQTGANGHPVMSRYSGEVMLTSNSMQTGPKTQHEEPSPQSEAMSLLRKVIARMDGEGPGGGEGPVPSVERNGSSDPSQPNSGASTPPTTTYSDGSGTPPAPRASSSAQHDTPQPGAIGGALIPSATPKAQATTLGDRSLVLPKGRTIDCSLTVRVVSGLPGMATCVLNIDVYSDNGRVVLLDRGSEAVGEYAATMVQGQQRLFVLWNRVKTPHGVIIEVNSPAADELGTAGIAGYIDRHWWERLGAAFMLSIIQDAIGFATASQADGTGGQQLGIYQNSAATGNRMAERILESTINIKPILYKNQGDRAMIFIARDLDFSSVYELHAN